MTIFCTGEDLPSASIIHKCWCFLSLIARIISSPLFLVFHLIVVTTIHSLCSSAFSYTPLKATSFQSNFIASLCFLIKDSVKLNVHLIPGQIDSPAVSEVIGLHVAINMNPFHYPSPFWRNKLHSYKLQHVAIPMNNKCHCGWKLKTYHLFS